MNITLACPRHLIVYHVLYVRNVKASGSYISGNQQPGGGGSEPVKVLQPLLLVELGMKGERGDGEKPQEVGQATDTVNRIAEDNCPSRMASYKIIEEEVFLCETTV